MNPPAVPLLQTKLHAPRRRLEVVSRARLDERLSPEALPAVVLVSAPAGFGKTTMLTDWLGRLGDDRVRSAWLSLDGRDSDPSVFWSYVIAALREVVPDVGAGALVMLQASPTALDSVVASLLNDLARSSCDVALVLDDYHAIESVDVQESVRYLIEHLPAHVHLLVASRSDPPWPLGGLRARGTLLEVRAADLRFDATEATAYLNGEMGLGLTAADVDVLHSRTEGWIAALQLAALSLRGRDDRSTFVAEFAGDDRFVVDYLLDEVLDRQSDEARSFLLDTSILSRLSAPLCAAVTGQSDAKAILTALERSNVFVVALDDRRQWFRYHHLFAEVLRARLADESPEQVAVLHRRASTWCEANGDRPEAIRHAIAAADFERAAELIEIAIPELRQTRQDATLRALLAALPDQIFETRPVLMLGKVGARMNLGDAVGVEALLDHVEGQLERGHSTDEMVIVDKDEFRRLPAQCAMYRAGLALLRGDFHATAAHGERAANLSDLDDHFGLGASSALVGLARWSCGDLDAAESRYTAAVAAFRSAGYIADVYGCSVALADIQVARGHLRSAEQTLTDALARASSVPLRGVADLHVALSELHVERNELDAAAEHLRISLALGEHLATPQHAYRWRVVDARLRSISGQHAGALERLREAEDRYNTDYSPQVRPVAATVARLQLAAGDIAGAAEWEARSGLSGDDALSYLREYEHLTLARVLLQSGRAASAVALLERLAFAADTSGRTGSSVEAQLLLALGRDACADRTAALGAITDALVRAEPERFVRIFLDEGAPMTTLLRTAVRHGRGAKQATTLLAASEASTVDTADEVDGSTRPASLRLVDPLSSRELQVLRLLRTELTGPEIAAELIVSLNTVRTHTKHIFSKLSVSNRRAAVRRADELGL